MSDAGYSSYDGDAGLGEPFAEWKTQLSDAGARDARLHDARHTAATVLLVLGIPQRAVMDFMGWSNHIMARRYQHITSTIQDDIAAKLGGFSGWRREVSLGLFQVDQPVGEVVPTHYKVNSGYEPS